MAERRSGGPLRSSLTANDAAGLTPSQRRVKAPTPARNTGRSGSLPGSALEVAPSRTT